MVVTNNITREKYTARGGGCELDLTTYGYEGEYMSAYQNYLGGGLLGGVANDCTISDWESYEDLVQLAEELREYYLSNSYHDEYNEEFEDRPVSAY